MSLREWNASYLEYRAKMGFRWVIDQIAFGAERSKEIAIYLYSPPLALVTSQPRLTVRRSSSCHCMLFLIDADPNFDLQHCPLGCCLFCAVQYLDILTLEYSLCCHGSSRISAYSASELKQQHASCGARRPLWRKREGAPATRQSEVALYEEPPLLVRLGDVTVATS